MFQYAAALVLRGHLKKPVFFPPPEYNRHSDRDYRDTLFYRILSKELIKGSYYICLESFTPWCPEQFLFNESIAIRGYFQYLPAIESIIPILRKDLIEFLTLDREFLRKKYALNNLLEVAFIHVRRGDYLNTAPELHWTQPPEYYEEALKHIPNLRCFVLSDDVEWCKSQPVFGSCEIVDESDELRALALMSLCHGGAILANSTFSWWGAILGAEPALSPVIYPSKWFDQKNPTLFPSRWIRI